MDSPKILDFRDKCTMYLCIQHNIQKNGELNRVSINQFPVGKLTLYSLPDALSSCHFPQNEHWHQPLPWQCWCSKAPPIQFPLQGSVIMPVQGTDLGAVYISSCLLFCCANDHHSAICTFISAFEYFDNFVVVVVVVTMKIIEPERLVLWGDFRSDFQAPALDNYPGPFESLYPDFGNGNPLQYSCLENLMDFPPMEEPGRLQSMGSQRVGHD